MNVLPTGRIFLNQVQHNGAWPFRGGLSSGYTVPTAARHSVWLAHLAHCLAIAVGKVISDHRTVVHGTSTPPHMQRILSRASVTCYFEFELLMNKITQ
jgi:ABC-type Fe3+ transport system permease subunit